MAPENNLDQLYNGTLRMGRMELTKKRWSNNIQSVYNTVDNNIHSEERILVFKKRIMSWIRVNINVFGDTTND